MTILILIVGLSLLILLHELGHMLAAKWLGRWVEEFGIGFPPRLVSKKIGETVYSINALPFGGFVKIHGEKPEFTTGELVRERSFAALSVGRRAIVIVAGVVMNFIIGWVLVSIVLGIGVPSAVIVTGVAADSPAAVAGMEAGDSPIGFSTTEEFSEFIAAAAGEPVAFDVLRGGEEISVTVTPRVDVPAGEGPLGVAIVSGGVEPVAFPLNVWEGLKMSVLILGAIFTAFGSLIVGIFTGGAALDQLVGPVGIFQVAGQAASFGIASLLNLIGLISLNLVVLNILPIPALDGGRLLFLLIEKIKGSPLPVKRELIANAIGFGMLLLLMVLITVRDVVRLF